MVDVDHDIWSLAQNVIGGMLNDGKQEEEILRVVLKITHGIAEHDSIRREIIRQKRMVVN